MNPGILKYQIEIQKPTGGRDTDGARITEFSPFGHTKAAIKYLSGRELFRAQQVQSEVTAEITIRYREGIKSKMRVVYQDRTFEIISPPIDKDNSRNYLTLLCKEIE